MFVHRTFAHENRPAAYVGACLLYTSHPDALYLIRAGEVYRLYNEDAAKGAKILGITVKEYPEHGFSTFAEFPRLSLIHISP